MIEKIIVNNQELKIKIPVICPHCHTGIKPELLNYASENGKLGVIYSCSVCSSIFFASYFISDHLAISPIAVFPHSNPQLPIPSQIKNYYPDFFKTYEQSAIAESYGLHEICGMGYRKSVELLVKHYLIDQHDEEKEKILSESLGASIRRITYPNIQTLAKAATWIGNDETHIVKKNPNYGVHEMKQFILSLCHLILAEKASEAALAMTEK